MHPEQVFVSRERELARLDSWLERARGGESPVCFVAGEAGAGKTVLLSEFARRAQASDPSLIVAFGDANAQTGIGDPYLPFREVLALLTGDVEGGLAQGRLTEKSASRLRRMVRTSGEILVENGPDLVGIFIPAGSILTRLGAMLARRMPWAARLEEMVQRKEKQRVSAPHGLEQAHIFEQYTNVLRALSRTQPLMLVLDDLQWADAGSISLLFHLIRRIGGSRVFLIGAYRPNDVALPRGGERHPLEPVLHELRRYFGEVVIDLGDAPEEERRAFIDALIDREPNCLDGAFRDELHRHTAGQPLFTVETLRNLTERGAVVRDASGAWTATPALSWSVIPARVEGVIAERIGRVGEELRGMLHVASVEGESFTAEVVARVQGLDDRLMVRRLSGELDRLHRLVSAQGVRRLGERRLSLYRFQHNLFQRYLYTGLGDVERSCLHEYVGNELEALYGERTWEIAVQLARHFEAARLPEKAARYRLLAGEQARRVFANVEAIGHFRRALEWIDAAAVPDRVEREWSRDARRLVHEKLGDVLALTGEHAEAEAALEHAAAALDGGDVAGKARLRRKLANVHGAQKRLPQAFAGFAAAEELLEGEPHGPAAEWDSEWCQTILDRLWLHYWTGDWRAMDALIERARDRIETTGGLAQRGYFMHLTVLARYRRDSYATSVATRTGAKAALAAARESGDAGWIARTHFGLAFDELWARDLGAAVADLGEVLAAARRMGDTVLELRCVVYLSVTHRLRGDVASARSLAEEAREAATRLRMQEYVGAALGVLAWAAWRDGNAPRARELGQSALDAWRELSVSYPVQWLAHWPLMALEIADRQLGSAVERARTLLSPEQQRPAPGVRAALQRAMDGWDAGRAEDAHLALVDALTQACQNGDL